MMKRWLVLVFAFVLAFSMVAVACAATNAIRYCADAGKIRNNVKLNRT